MKIYTVFVSAFLFSCAPTSTVISNRVVLSSSAIDQSSLIDTNNDKKTDIERWYRGSQIAFEKIDEDYDGYWDKQGRRHSDGSFDVHYIYPKKKYSVKSHHIFYASRDHPENVTILAR